MSARDLYPEKFEAAATVHGYLDAAQVPREAATDDAIGTLSLQGRVLWLVTAVGAMIPKDEIVDAAAIRDLAGIKNRRTLQAWRESKGFPEPFAEMSGHIELWDAREVRHWLEENR